MSVSEAKPCANCMMVTVVTQGLLETLGPGKVEEAFRQIQAKMSEQDPENPNLWTVEVDGKAVWAVLDERAGLNGEDVLTLLFPSEY